jgi:hypothetical protein
MDDEGGWRAAYVCDVSEILNWIKPDILVERRRKYMARHAADHQSVPIGR